MSSAYEKIVKKNYNQKLVKERATKGLYNTVYVPKNINSINLLPISNLFYGNQDFPPRLKLLDEHIRMVNDMENGAFFLGGNLFYYPPGQTEEKWKEADQYIEHLTKILERADKNKILLAYDGINESKFKDDRKLKYPIETTRVLADNLGILDRYYADTKVELNFVFNNELTEYTNQFMYGLFTSLRPISETKNAIMNKFKNNFLLNGEKNFVIDTSSSQLVEKKKKLIVSENPLLSKAIDVTWLSVAGYVDMPQIINKGNRYAINQKIIELKIEERNSALGQQSAREINTIIDEKWKRSVQSKTIGVAWEKYFDPKIYEELNKTLIRGLYIKDELTQSIQNKVNERIRKDQSELIQELYAKKDGEVAIPKKPSKKSKSSGFTFE